MEDRFLQMTIENLTPAHRLFKQSNAELDSLSYLVQQIKIVEYAIEQRESLREDVSSLMTELNTILDELTDIMNDSKNWTNRYDYDFRSIAARFQTRIRTITKNIFPEESEPPRSSRYIPPVLQRTSKRLSKKVLKAMTSGTKYRDYYSLASWQRNKYNYRIMFIALAWSLAIVGMILSIGFLTRDFVIAQRNLAIQFDRSQIMPLQLPAVTICSNHYGVPPFTDYPTTEFPGLPLFAISLYNRNNRSLKLQKLSVTFPSTSPRMAGSPVEPVLVTNEERSCQTPGFDVHRETKLLRAVSMTGSVTQTEKNGSNCQYCFRIGYKQREILKPINTYQSAATFEPAIQIVVSKPRLYGVCQSSFQSGYSFVEKLIASELLQHASELEQRGILNFDGHNHSVLAKTLREYGVSRSAEFYCNTYFFSGFFYPSLDRANISYRFSGEMPNIWEQVGSGPYFSVYSWDPDDSVVVGPNTETLWRDTYTLGGIRLYAEDADTASPSRIVSPLTEFAVLDHLIAGCVFTFRKVNTLGRIQYPVKKSVTHRAESEIKLVDFFRIGFDFESYEVERIYAYATMSWTEYVTDIFEFIGLFTGICIFTLLVVPATHIKRDGD